MKELVLIPFFVLHGTQTDGCPAQEVIKVQDVQDVESVSNSLSYTISKKEHLQQENTYEIFFGSKNDVNGIKALLFTDICDNEVNIKLKKPFMICYRKYGEYYIAESEGINVCCWGRNVNELKEDINENLYVLYKNFVDCDKSELTLDAIHLRSKLEELFA